jgi:hypothetical protein
MIWSWVIFATGLTVFATGLAVGIVLLIDISGRWPHRFALWRHQASPGERRLGRLLFAGLSLEALLVGLRTAHALPDRTATIAVLLASVLISVPAVALLYLRASGRLGR